MTRLQHSRSWASGAALLLAIALSWPAAAQAQPPAETFAKGTAALEQGSYGQAVAEFESLADRGFQHPDASYNRALAYVGRARTLQAEPGDLGRAAAALSETLLLRPDDRDAEQALQIVRSEIGRRLSRTGRAPVMARPSLGRAVTSLLPEDVWASVAVLGAVAAAVGLALRRFSARHPAQLAGGIALGVGLLLLLLGAVLTASARHLRLAYTPAVVVAEQARLLDESGRPLAAGRRESDSIPEGAEVYVAERRGGLSRVQWGNSEGWVVAGQVRELAAVQR